MDNDPRDVTMAAARQHRLSRWQPSPADRLKESVIEIGPEANDQRRHVDRSVLGSSTQHTKRSVRPLTVVQGRRP